MIKIFIKFLCYNLRIYKTFILLVILFYGCSGYFVVPRDKTFQKMKTVSIEPIQFDQNLMFDNSTKRALAELGEKIILPAINHIKGDLLSPKHFSEIAEIIGIKESDSIDEEMRKKILKKIGSTADFRIRFTKGTGTIVHERFPSYGLITNNPNNYLEVNSIPGLEIEAVLIDSETNETLWYLRLYIDDFKKDKFSNYAMVKEVLRVVARQICLDLADNSSACMKDLRKEYVKLVKEV